MRLDIFPPTLFSLIFLALPILIYSFLLLDRLIQAEYESHRAAWEADGRPMGFFFFPPGQNCYTSFVAAGLGIAFHLYGCLRPRLGSLLPSNIKSGSGASEFVCLYGMFGGF